MQLVRALSNYVTLTTFSEREKLFQLL